MKGVIHAQMPLSDNFCLRDMCESLTARKLGLPNMPRDLAEVENLKALCTRVLDPVCARLSGRVRILSAFRTQTLNRLMGGAFDGAHVFGQAVDLMVEGVSAPDVARTLAAMPDLPFDTLFLVRRALQNGDHCAYVTLSHRRLGGNRRHVGTRSMGAAGTLQEDVGLPAPGPAHTTNLSTAA